MRTYQGELSTGRNGLGMGVVWFNTEQGCLLRICGLDPKAVESLERGELLDITIHQSVAIVSGADTRIQGIVRG